MKSITPMLALLPILAFALFYIADASYKDALVPSANSAPSSAHNLAKTPQFTEQIHDQVLVRNVKSRRFELEEKLNATMAKSAASRSVEREQRVIEASMRLREPAFRELFQSWGLDFATTDQVFKIVRDRETRLMEARYQRDKAGVAGFHKPVIDTQARTELVQLLGVDRFQELARLETQMNTADRTKVDEFLRNRSAE